LRWSLEQEIQELSRRGIREIGIWRTKLSDLDTDTAADLLYSHDVRVSSLSWAGGFTGSCGMSHVEAIADGFQAIRTAARIGAECLLVHPGDGSRHTRRHSRRLFSDAIDELLPAAIDFGVTLGVEILNRRESRGWTVFDSFDETIDFVGNHGTPQLGLVLDLFHAGDDRELLQQVSRFSSRLVLVQLADRLGGHGPGASRCRLGEGTVPLLDWFNALEDHGYQGSYEIEAFGQRFGQSRYRKLLDDSLASFEQLQQQRTAAGPSAQTV
jgi:sugar phosphate isomerase/epimerase